MAIRLRNVKANQAELLTSLGAVKITTSKLWTIPESIEDINPFKEWLPQTESFIVQRPHFVARAKAKCHKCGRETPVVGLGAKNFYYVSWGDGEKFSWAKLGDNPIMFNQINYLDKPVVVAMKEYYPYFQHKYCKNLEEKIWGNACIHCHVMQETNDDFVYDRNPLEPITFEDALEIRIIYFKLAFDYFIDACYCQDQFYYDIIN